MIPPHSCPVPGKNPATSSNEMSGILNASQNRTNRAPFTEASMSSTPARNAGWLATIPTDRPSRRAKPTTRFFAKCSWTSKKYLSSATEWIPSQMSYGSLGSVDITVLDVDSRLSIGVSDGRAGDGGAWYVAGRINVARRVGGRVAAGRGPAANRHAIVWHTV